MAEAHPVPPLESDNEEDSDPKAIYQLRTANKKHLFKFAAETLDAIQRQEAREVVTVLKRQLLSIMEDCEATNERYILAAQLDGQRLQTAKRYHAKIELELLPFMEKIDEYLNKPATPSATAHTTPNSISTCGTSSTSVQQAEATRRRQMEEIQKQITEAQTLLIRLQQSAITQQNGAPPIQVSQPTMQSLSSPATQPTFTTPSSRPSTIPPQGAADAWIYDTTTTTANYFGMPWAAPNVSNVEIKPFDGNPREWHMFIASFKSLIHDVIPSNSQRIAYLRELLSPEVRKSIAQSLHNPDLYYHALQNLQQLYGHPQMIASAYVQTLLNLPHVKPNDPLSLRKYFSDLHGTIPLMEKEGLIVDLQSSTLLEHVLTKLPNNIRSSWGEETFRVRSEEQRALTLFDLDKWLTKKVMGQQFCPPLPNNQREVSKPTKPPQRERHHVLTTSINPAAKEFTCSFCEKPHKNSACDVFRDCTPERRTELVKNRKCCFRCLAPNHQSKDCRSTRLCNVNGCRGNHNPLLHDAPRAYNKSKSTANATTSNRTPSTPSEPSIHIGHVNEGQQFETVLLPVVPVILTNGNKQIKTCAILDKGSQVSLVKEDIANALGLQGEPYSAKMGTFHERDPVMNGRIVKLTISSTNGQATFSDVKAYTVPHVGMSYWKINWPKEKHRYSHLSNLNIPAVDTSQVSVLIGQKVRKAHRIYDIQEPEHDEGLEANLTPFGWTIVGDYYADQRTSDNPQSILHLSTPEDQLISETLQKFWEIEASGTTKQRLLPANEEKALEILKATTENIGNRYVSGLLWKSPNPALPDNYTSALYRFKQLERRLLSDDNLRIQYQKTVEDYIKAGYAEVVNEEKFGEFPGKTWYLPHHPVLHPNKPGKVRVVFDASAQYQGRSLNSALLKGPDFLTNLVGVFLRFRLNPVAVSADVEKMYYQVKVREEDKAAFRFLWKEPGSPTPPRIYQMTVHVFGAVSSPATCMFALQRTAKDNAEAHPETAQKVLSNFYVDNYLDSFETEQAASETARDITDLLKKGGFRLTQWVSNSRNVLKGIAQTEWVNPSLSLTTEDLPTERTLGILWNCEEDVFIFDLSSAEPAETKRGILSQIASIYDPFGFLAPLSLFVKIILQSLWRQGVNWDDEIPANLLKDWKEWYTSLQSLKEVKIPRCLRLDEQPISKQIHVFTDASEDGFGTVAYLRTEYPRDSVQLRFIMSKSRVAPIKPTTIPRLELCAAVLGARLASAICPEIGIPINQVYFWSDSQTTLQWIKSSTRKFKAFVGNRIGEILESTNAQQWRHVPGKLNPADTCSRGTSADSWDYQAWLSGPEFLHEPENKWPSPIQHAEPNDEEIIADPWLGMVTNTTQENRITALFERKSELTKVLRILAYVLRFVKSLRQATKKNVEKKLTYLTASEIREATKTAIVITQRENFAKDFEAIEKTGTTFKESPLLKLNPFTDEDEILRVGGRLKNSDMPYSSKHPAILPSKSQLTKLIVMDAHTNLAHSSTERTLQELRSQYWPIKGRQTVKAIIGNCAFCRKNKATPRQPFMGDLPVARIEPFNPPFTFTGIDFFGPLYVTVKRSTEKRWGCLYTCMTTRAVHLELCNKLDADSFLLSFRRFIARRRTPAKCFTDNGTNFVAGERELREGTANWNHEKIANSMAAKGIEWQFSPPSAPHFGGCWESLVKSAKKALQVVMQGQRCNEEILQTVFTEVESLLNGRPLTHLSMDPNDPEPLTPNHFLVGDQKPNIPPDVVSDTEALSRRRWRATQAIINQFWRRWMREYVPGLTERGKWNKKLPNIQPGNVVLVVDVNTPRGHWPIGKITQVFPGKDGVVRTAEVKTQHGIYVRPVNKLCVFVSD